MTIAVSRPVTPFVEPAASNASCVLIVDDDPDLARALSRIAVREGYAVVTAHDITSACEAIDAGGIDVILTDMRLPDGDGLRVLDTAHARDPELPVIMLTGAPELESAVSALERGALRYLTKPVEPTTLLAALSSASRLRALSQSGEWAMSDPANAFRALGEVDRRFEDALASVYLVFQPVVSWSRRTTVAYEALTRSHEPSLTSPDELLATAEKLGRLHDLGRTIRARAAAALARFPDQMDVFVNLHPADLEDDDLYDRSAPLSRHAHRVVLEITERSSIDALSDVGTRMTTLRALGYRIAVDDLGAGYASLSALAILRPDLVKLDMSLVRDVRRDPTRQVVVRALNALCTQLGVITVAEGVETSDELAGVLNAGGDLLQGYLFARPDSSLPVVDFDAVDQADAPPPMGAAHRPALRSRHLPGELARTLCHDLRIPLSAMVGLAALLRDGKVGMPTADQRGVGEDLLRHAGHVDALLGALVELIDDHDLAL
jgi:EAL domain-containing protein (putative c-di-GMP-specific phosphodiesterase class I)